MSTSHCVLASRRHVLLLLRLQVLTSSFSISVIFMPVVPAYARRAQLHVAALQAGCHEDLVHDTPQGRADERREDVHPPLRVLAGQGNVVVAERARHQAGAKVARGVEAALRDGRVQHHERRERETDGQRRRLGWQQLLS